MLRTVFRYTILIFAVFALNGFVLSQNPPDETKIIAEAIEKEGCTITDEGKVKVCKFDYQFEGKNVEAISYRPVAEGKYPAIMMIPGFTGTPQRYIYRGRMFAKEGFAAISVGTPGFGKTDLEPDYIGKNTIDAFIAGYEKFKKESFIDPDKMGIFGYSRGAMATSLMLTRLKDVKAAVLGGGVYNLKKVYEESSIEGIKKNIKRETGGTDEAFRERSSVYKVKNITSPILIVHGAKDINVPVNQACLLRDALEKHGKEFEIKIFEDKAHGVGPGINPLMMDFFSRKLKGTKKAATKTAEKN